MNTSSIFPLEKKTWRTVGLALLSLWGLLLIAQTLRIAVATPPSFDGSMNLEVARSLSQGEGYRRLYADRAPFPHEIQTNAPYILPAAAVFNVLGVGVAQSELASIAYLLALMLLVTLLMYRSGGGHFSILGPALVLATPNLLEYGLEGYGEVPALTWFFAAVIAYFDTENARPSMWRSAVAGLFLALALLTKTVMLLCMAAFAACVFLQLIFHRGASKRRTLYSLFWLAAGAILPIIAFEKWKEIGLGGLHAWYDWWHYEGHAILFQAGVQRGSSHTFGALSEKVWGHLGVLAQSCQVPMWLTVTWAVLLLVATFTAVLLAVRDRKLLATAAVLGVAALYFVWWLAITPDAKTWLRRILDGIICANVGFAMLGTHLIGRERAKPKIPRLSAAMALASIPAVLLVISTVNIFSTTPPDNSRLLQVVEEVRLLPRNAYLFGIGWESSPLISLLSGRHFVDFNDMPNGGLDAHRPMYLVRSRGLPSAKSINETFSIYGVRLQTGDQAGTRNLQAIAGTQALADTAVYRLPELRPAPIRLNKGPVLSRIQYVDAYPYIRGPYPAEPGNGRWMRTDNIVVLEPTSSGMFFLNGYAVPQKHFEYPHPVEALISFNGCSTPPQNIPTGTTFTIEIHALQYCKLDTHEPWTVRIQVNNVVESGLTSDERELSLLFKSMGFR